MKSVLSGFLGKFTPRVLAIFLSAIVGAVIFVVTGADPLMAYQALIQGAFIGTYQIAETMVKVYPLLLAGLGIAVAFKAGVWNIGAEGQIIMGAITAAGLGFGITGLPSIIHIPLIVILSFMTGAAWATIPAILKIKVNANEILTTLILNYIAYWISVYLILWPWDDPLAYTPQTPRVATSAMLPRLIPETRCHVGILFAIACALLLYVIMKKTVLGFEIRVMGANPTAAKQSGINLSKTILIAMIISGGLAGLAGMGEVIGRDFILRYKAFIGEGYLAIAVALFGNLDPIGIIFSALFFGALRNGADLASRVMKISPLVAWAITGATILFMQVEGLMFRYLSKLLTKKGKGKLFWRGQV